MRLTEEEYAALMAKRTARPLEIPVLAPPEPPKESKLERRFAQQLADNPDLPEGQRHYFALQDRDFEIDFAWSSWRVGVEVQGMAHRIKGKWKRDIEKRALLLLAGWRILELDGASIKDGRGLAWLRALLETR